MIRTITLMSRNDVQNEYMSAVIILQKYPRTKHNPTIPRCLWKFMFTTSSTPICIFCDGGLYMCTTLDMIKLSSFSF